MEITEPRVIEARRRRQLLRDRENRQAFLLGYLQGMCRRNCWTYSSRTGEDVRIPVGVRQLAPSAVVAMAHTAESFRRAQYAHLVQAVEHRANYIGGTRRGAWLTLGDAFGVSRDLITLAFTNVHAGPESMTLQSAAREHGRAGLYKHRGGGPITLDDHYQHANGEPKA